MSKKQYWFTSDTHFKHTNIIKYCNRPFVTRDEMDEKIIENWNSLIKPEDIVFFLGDFIFTYSKDVLIEYTQKLNGEKILILGNHDHFSEKDYLEAGWTAVYNMFEQYIKNKHIVMCHYSMKQWNCSHNGSIMIFGHEHWKKQYELNHEAYKSLFMSEKTVNVCQDSNNFKPYSIDEIIKICEDRPTNFFK